MGLEKLVASALGLSSRAKQVREVVAYLRTQMSDSKWQAELVNQQAQEEFKELIRHATTGMGEGIHAHLDQVVELLRRLQEVPVERTSPAIVDAQHRPSLVALEAADVPEDAHDPHRCLWQMLHLSRMCHVLTETDEQNLESSLAVAESGTKDFDYWPNGKHAFSCDTWYYPNGKHAFSCDTWYYPNGKHAFSCDTWYYPNGKHAFSCDTWYYPNGKRAGSEGSIMSFCLGGVDREARPRVLSGFRSLHGYLRQLATVQLAWLAELNGT